MTVFSALRIDNTANRNYTENNDANGGTQNVSRRSLEADSDGISGVYDSGDAGHQGRSGLGGSSVASGFVLSEQARNAIQSRGVEVVFKNNALNKTSHALDGAMPQALALGGVKLDCYGDKLANTYERSGFITHYSLKNPPIAS